MKKDYSPPQNREVERKNKRTWKQSKWEGTEWERKGRKQGKDKGAKGL